MQSTLHVFEGALPPVLPRPGLRPHVAIIMDGNGRWATARGWPRADGHRAGIRAVRRVVEAAPRLGVATLTLYGFSADNWRRPPAEVATILDLFRFYLEKEAKRLAGAGVRCTIIGRRDRLPAALLAAITAVEAATREGRGLWLRLAIDYSSRAEIASAAGRLWRSAPGRERAGARLASSIEGGAGPV
ncbi:MAG TPA: polyprenyl diphosphate synthase, partial [Candidatus Acidoferrales bacterium]|nr:polyprenyl diphosphate synthase [Candidatus Acidoferrales bacterium]